MIIKGKTKTAQTETQPNKTLNHKVVTFLQPAPSLDDRASLCQSPSWEAYDRRKKEKKEKEQADKEAKSKKRRLTKAPPSPTAAAAPAGSTSAANNPPVCTTPNKAAASRGPMVQAQTSSCIPESRTRHSQPQPAADQSASASMALYNSDLPLDLPIPAPHTPRGRSGSFSSLFKAPFEFRRSSIDHERERDTGFIGGIKLEQHRTAAYQKALEDSIIGPEGEIHPAFRKERRSSSPLRFLTPRHTSRDAEDRHYPPIAIRTTGNQALVALESSKTEDGGMMKKWRERVGLKASSKDAGSDTENTKRGRTRRLSKSSPQRDQSATRPNHAKNASMPAIKLPASRHGEPIATSAVGQESDKPAAYVDDRLNLTLPPISPLSPSSIVQDAVNGDQEHKPAQPSPLSLDDRTQAYFDATEEPAPPPPRKSSKRKSLISLSDANVTDRGPLNLNPLGIELPPVITPDASDARRSSTSLSEARAQKQPAERKPPSKLNKANRQSLSDPPSIPYDSLTPGRSPARDSSLPPKRTLRDAARAAFGRPVSSASEYVIPATSSSRPASRSKSPYLHGPAADPNITSARDSSNLSKPARVLGEVDWRTGYSSSTSASPPTNSSEESGSDDGPTPDTPDTSRPQSERGGSSDPDDAKRGRLSTTASALPSPALPSPAFSQSTEPRRSTEKPNTVELDSIQAAAMKVMAAFPDPPPKRLGGDWRSSSDTNLTTSFLPKTKRQSFQSQSPRDRSKPRPINTNIAPAKDPESKSPPLRDLLLSKDESAATAPWPATYLEAARKAAPAAPAPKTLKQQASSSTPNLAPPKRIGGPSNRSSRQSSPHQKIGTHATSASAEVDGEPIAKMFVECCGCKYYHDMPSKLYEAMAHPEDVVSADTVEFAGSVSMTVKCPWCKHDMSTKCCAGLAAMVYVKERLH